MIIRQQQRGDTAEDWTAVNPVLRDREFGIETDTGYLKVGDGVRPWNLLPYSGGGLPNAPLTFGQAGVSASKDPVSTDKVVMNHSLGSIPGYDGTGPVYTPTSAQTVAECNWNTASILPASGSLGYNQTGPANSGIKTFDFTTMLEGSFFFSESAHLGGYYEHTRFWVDDQPITTYLDGGPTGTFTDRDYVEAVTTGLHGYNLVFKKPGLYKIRGTGIVNSASTGIFGTNSTNILRKPKARKTMAIVSDSYFDTLIYTSQNTANFVGAELDMRMWNCARGGSGFVNPVENGAYGNQSYPSDQVFAKLAAAPAIDAILVNGSVNDLPYPTDQVLAAMRTFFDRVRSDIGQNTPIIWVGLEPESYFTAQYPLAAIKAREELQRQVAASDRNVVGTILPSAEEWLTGTGNIAAPNGTGNQDRVISQDTIHAGAYGTKYYGSMIGIRSKSFPTTVRG